MALITVNYRNYNDRSGLSNYNNKGMGIVPN